MLVSSYIKMNKFCSFYFNRQRFRGLPGFGVGLMTDSCHSLFFLFACPFVSRVIPFFYDVLEMRVVSRFNENAQSFFVWGSS